MYIGEPSPEDTVSILRGLKLRYELHHAVRIRDEALRAAAKLSSRYLPDRFLPDKGEPTGCEGRFFDRRPGRVWVGDRVGARRAAEVLGANELQEKIAET